MPLKFTFLALDDIKSYYQYPIDFKIVFFLFNINNDDIAISKLVSQSKLLSSLFKLKENDSIIKSSIIKQMCHEREVC